MIVIDIETTGTNPRLHSMLSLGAVDYTTGREFYDECSIYPNSLVDPTTMEMNGLDIEKHKPGIKQPAASLFIKFVDWAATKCANNILAGHNVGHLDILFLEHFKDFLSQTFPFSYQTVDLHSLAFLVFGKSMKNSEICIALGLPPKPKPHNALHGARSEAAAFRKIFKMVELKTNAHTVRTALNKSLETLLAAYRLKQGRDNGTGCDLINAAINETILALHKENRRLVYIRG